ncbi:MAG: hypothetical protein CMJ29_00330 [Phycisphaerae bacterium]|nr:hypothetical protein [Phycisphaerae bacterium]
MDDGSRTSGPQPGGPFPGGPRIRFVNLGSDRMAQAFQAAQGQPNWVVRIVVLTFLLVIGIPILLLLLVAGLAAAMVFMVLSTINWIMVRLGGSTPKDDGRRNVRVIKRD